MRSHLFTPFTLAVCLQIALSATIALYIALASALAVAAHHQSPKCAALFSRPLAFDLGFDEGDAHFFRAARWAVRWISQTTYAFRVFFVPTTSQFGWSDACFGWLQGVLAVTSASSTLDHRNDHNQTAEPTGPERERVGMLAAFLHEISLSTPRVVAGPPILSVL
jgi:hypothetical protein